MEKLRNDWEDEPKEIKQDQENRKGNMNLSLIVTVYYDYICRVVLLLNLKIIIANKKPIRIEAKGWER